MRASHTSALGLACLLLLPALPPLASGCAGNSGSAPPAARVAPCVSGQQDPPQELMLERRGETIYICSRQTLLAEARGVSEAALADVDGDGKLEVLLQWAPPGTAHHRLHVYGVAPTGIVPKWRGSRMSGELLHFAVPGQGRDGRDPVVTLERLDGKLYLLLYAWDGFGFAARCTLPVGDATSGEVKLECNELAVLCELDGQTPSIACRRN